MGETTILHLGAELLVFIFLVVLGTHKSFVSRSSHLPNCETNRVLSIES
jgi:hypothetical protein